MKFYNLKAKRHVEVPEGSYEIIHVNKPDKHGSMRCVSYAIAQDTDGTKMSRMLPKNAVTK